MFSKLWTVNAKDFIHSLALTLVTAALQLIYQFLLKREMIDWREVAIVSIIAGIAFILQRLGTDDQNKLLGKV